MYVSGKWKATPKGLWFDQYTFRIWVESGDHVKYLSDVKTFNCCAGTTSKILDGSTFNQVSQYAAGIGSTIAATTFPKPAGTCDATVSCDFLKADFVYEKEFYFFDKFTVSNGGKCA